MTLTDTITTEVRRTRAVLTDPKPLHAVAGAGDLVVARVREAAADRQRALRSVRLDRVGGAVREAVLGLPDRAQDVVTSAVGQVATTYDGLADRGADLVHRVRHQAASRRLADDVTSTVKAARETAESVRETTASAGAAASAAADKAGTGSTARRRATTTRTTPAAKRSTTRAKA